MKVCTEEKDPNPTFPWTLFKEELLSLKEQQQSCVTRQLFRVHGCFRKLQRIVWREDAEKGHETMRGLRACEIKCPKCSKAHNQLLHDLCLDGSFSDTVAAMKKISGAGQQITVKCQELRFTKARITDSFEHGPQAGTKLEELVDRLANAEERIKELVLTAVRFHDELYVVEGNRRLWCIKEAQRRLEKDVEVTVRVPDLYLGFIHRQEYKEPALRYFLQRFDPSSGREIEIVSNSTAHAGNIGVQNIQRTTNIVTNDGAPQCERCNMAMVKKTNRTDKSQFGGVPIFFHRRNAVSQRTFASSRQRAATELLYSELTPLA